jgi:hypothetical protein
MKNFIRNLFAVVAVVLFVSHAAFAKVSVPEIDPSMGTGALALLGGAIMVIRGRTKKRD